MRSIFPAPPQYFIIQDLAKGFHGDIVYLIPLLAKGMEGLSMEKSSVTFGKTMLRLLPPGCLRFSQAT